MTGTYSGIGQGYCTPCPPGTYNSNTGSTSSSACLECAAGKYSGYNEAKCSSCISGTYSDIGQGNCSPCSPGTYNSNTGSNSSSACLKCTAGKYSNGGASNCTLCDTGKYNQYSGNTSSAACYLCDAGTYNPNTGSNSSLACTTCPSSDPISPPGSAICFPYAQAQCKVITSLGEGSVGNISLLLTIPFAFIGGLLYYIRSKTSSVEVCILILGSCCSHVIIIY